MNRRRIYLFLPFLLCITLSSCNIIYNIPGVDQRARDSFEMDNPASLSLATNSFRFAVVADMQVRDENKTRIEGLKEKVSSKNIDFVIICGDLTENANDLQYNHAKENLDSLGVPVLKAIGNHDLYNQDAWARWQDYFGPSVYTINLSNAFQFIILDTATGRLGKVQQDYLKEKLQEPAQFRFVVSHFAIREDNAPSPWRLASADERNFLMSQFKEHSVTGFFAGHYHTFISGKYQDTWHFTTGSFYSYDLDAGVPAILVCTIENGSFSWEKVDL